MFLRSAICVMVYDWRAVDLMFSHGVSFAISKATVKQKFYSTQNQSHFVANAKLILIWISSILSLPCHDLQSPPQFAWQSVSSKRYQVQVISKDDCQKIANWKCLQCRMPRNIKLKMSSVLSTKRFQIQNVFESDCLRGSLLRLAPTRRLSEL